MKLFKALSPVLRSWRVKVVAAGIWTVCAVGWIVLDPLGNRVTSIVGAVVSLAFAVGAGSLARDDRRRDREEFRDFGPEVERIP